MFIGIPKKETTQSPLLFLLWMAIVQEILTAQNGIQSVHCNQLALSLLKISLFSCWVNIFTSVVWLFFLVLSRLLLLDAIRKYRDFNKVPPDTIYVYRDGIGANQAEGIEQFEINNIRQAFTMIDPNYQ